MRFHLSAAALALSAVLATPAAAQVNGIGITEPSLVIAGSQALQTAYGQISTTFQAQRTQLEQSQQQRAALIRQFDTDNDGQLSQEEQTAAQANTTVIQQVQALDQTIAQTQEPITRARVYALEQIAQQYNAAQQQVATQSGVQLILTPDSVVYAADAVDLTDEIVAALNQLVPTVATTPPDGWQPQRQSIALYQQVQDILLTVAVQQQQQAQAQQGQQAAPAQPAQGR